MTKKHPTPLFDSVEHVSALMDLGQLSAPQNLDYQKARQFLLAYKDNAMTFNAYRREIERLLQWCLYATKLLPTLSRDDFESYIKFCQKPPRFWIGLKKVSRFIVEEGQRIPNPDWRPFVATVSKAETGSGKKPHIEDFCLVQKSLREIFTVCSSFFNFLIQENYLPHNPVAQIRQKSKYFTKQQSQRVVRKLSELQWMYVIETAHIMAKENPDHERTLFIMNALFGMYLRISELAASQQWVPKMGDFARDADGFWWFTTVGKGNKERQIAVSTEMLNALKRWRTHLGFAPLPSRGEMTSLIPKQLGNGPITSTRPIRRIVQACFDQAIFRLSKDNHADEADQLKSATVHWLRHTGISEDVKIRPREHVRDDAGHSSSAITDRYIDVELRERNQSARKKTIVPEIMKDQ
jgi:site-specific recombinase XerD